MNIKSELNKLALLSLLNKQLNNFFFLTIEENKTLQNAFDEVWEKVFYCFKDIDNKYFKREGVLYFNPYHSGQYLIYLYYFSYVCSMIFKNKGLADKLYYLNKLMHACDIYHEVSLPTSFFLEHPVGTVLGRATYGNHFFAMQNCTVGGNKNKYPTIGNNAKLYSGAKVLGNSHLGNNVTLAANTYVKDTNIPNNATVFGQSPNLIIKYL